MYEEEIKIGSEKEKRKEERNKKSTDKTREKTTHGYTKAEWRQKVYCGELHGAHSTGSLRAHQTRKNSHGIASLGSS